jgi:hypothetical protein
LLYSFIIPDRKRHVSLKWKGKAIAFNKTRVFIFLFEKQVICAQLMIFLSKNSGISFDKGNKYGLVARHCSVIIIIEEMSTCLLLSRLSVGND